MIKSIIILLLLSSIVFFAQDKYFIYFKDKGTENKSRVTLSKASVEKAKSLLSEKALERRIRRNGFRNAVNYDDYPVSTVYINKIEAAGIKIENTLKWFNSVSAYLSEKQIELLKSYSFIEKIEPVRSLKSKHPYKTYLSKSGETSDINYGPSFAQNNLSEIPVLHKHGINGKGIIVGLLDTGFRWDASDVYDSLIVIDEYDFVNNDSITKNQSGDPAGQDFHGSAVLSIAAGYKSGILIGPAYKASFLLAKTENTLTERNVEEDNYAAALEWMEAKGADLASSSLGYSEFDLGETSYTYEDMDGKTAICTKAAEIAFSKGMLIITSAGNEGNDAWYYITAPADGENVLAIGAVNSSGAITSFSSRGPTYDNRIKPELTAMGSGVQLFSVDINSFSSGGGTSYSAPIVAGIAAQIMSIHPYISNTDFRELLKYSGNRFSTPDNTYGYGILSARRAANYPVFDRTGSGNLYKGLFLNDTPVLSSLKLKYSGSGVNLSEITAMSEQGNVFKYPAESLINSDSVYFYFSYNTSGGASITEPEGDYAYFSAKGSPIIIKEFKGKDTSDIKELPVIPSEFKVYQNYPNPFNPGTKIAIDLPQNGNVTINVYNQIGQKVRTLANADYKSSGKHTYYFDASGLATGIYFFRVEAVGKVFTGKMIYVK